MTPLNPQSPQTGSSSFIRGLSLGLALFLTVACVGTGLGFVYVKGVANSVRKGWNLVPVVTAAVDIKGGTRLTMAMITQRSIPEQFVTSSVVKPDSASSVFNQEILVDVQAGDPLQWSQFEITKVRQPVVLFATTDLTSGRSLSAADVEERPVRESLITTSWVRTEDRPQALGKKVLAAFRKGDPILWTQLETTR